MKHKILTREELKKRKKMKFFKLLNDEDFWDRLQLISFNHYRIIRLREYRTKFIIPKQKFIIDYINEDYRLVTKDNRTVKEIIIDLFSEEQICEEKDQKKIVIKS